MGSTTPPRPASQAWPLSEACLQLHPGPTGAAAPRRWPGAPCAPCPSQSGPGIPGLQQGRRKGQATGPSPRHPSPTGCRDGARPTAQGGGGCCGPVGRSPRRDVRSSSECWREPARAVRPDSDARAEPQGPLQLLLLLLSCFSCGQFCATSWTAGHQAPPSLGFSRQEHWSGLPFPSPTHESEK